MPSTCGTSSRGCRHTRTCGGRSATSSTSSSGRRSAGIASARCSPRAIRTITSASIHNWIDLYDNNQPWVTHASIQNGSATTEFGRANLYRDVWEKPVVLDEIKYEGDIPDRWGNITAQQLVHQFWIATVAGCYASHGESFLTESGSLHMVEGGRLRGAASRRGCDSCASASTGSSIPGLDPIDKWDDPAYVAGAPREQYLQYLGACGSGAVGVPAPAGHRRPAARSRGCVRGRRARHLEHDSAVRRRPVRARRCAAQRRLREGRCTARPAGRRGGRAADHQGFGAALSFRRRGWRGAP